MSSIAIIFYCLFWKVSHKSYSCLLKVICIFFLCLIKKFPYLFLSILSMVCHKLFLFIYSFWSWLRFLDLWLMPLIKFGKILIDISLNIFSVLFLLFWDSSYTYISSCPTWNFCLIFINTQFRSFYFFSLCASVWMFSCF